MAKSVVLLSAGLDSTVNLYKAHSEMDVALALTFNYGQKAAQKEIERSEQMCGQLGIPHKVIELPWFSMFTKSALVNPSAEIPVGESVSIDDLETSHGTAEKVWVPNRNGIFLNIGAAFAESLGAEFVVPGFNLEEAATFPDNTGEFLFAMSNSLSFSTSNKVIAKSFTTKLNKTQIVELGRSLDVAFDMIWSCYFAGEKMCGECESCQRFFRAMGEV